MSNPYTLVFGQPPIEVIERNAQAERIISEYTQDRPSNYINMITGIRGCGKTVFVTQIAERLRLQKDWIIVNLNPQRDLLESLAAKLNSDRGLSRIFEEAEINLQAFSLGIGIKGVQPVTDIEEALNRMLREIDRRGKRVLITIDEVINSRNMRIFTSAYQILLRERLPVFLLMTGLFKNIDQLKNAEGMTFLERAPRTVLSPLNEAAIALKYKETLEISEARANRLAKISKGYAFAFQIIGYFTWENPDDEERALKEARDYLYEFAYWKIWSELSRKDKEVLSAIVKEPTGQVYQIRERLGYTSNQFNPYRDRLIKAGVICGPEPGIVSFTLPWFDEFIAAAEA